MYPKDTIFDDWLQWFGREAAPTAFEVRPGLRCCTNGNLAVCVNDSGPIEESPSRVIAEKISKLFGSPILKMTTMPTQALAAAMEPCDHPTVKKCKSCHGTCKVPHFCDCELCEAEEEKCEECDGTGKSEKFPDPQYFLAWGNPVNANYIAYILEHAPRCDTVSIRLCLPAGWSISAKTNHLHLVTDRWHAITVCMEEAVKREHVCTELFPDLASPAPTPIPSTSAVAP